MRLIFCLLISFLASCQSSNLEFKGNSTAIARVRLNSMISDTLPFKADRVKEIKTSDLVFFSGYINGIVDKFNLQMDQLNSEFKVYSINMIKERPVYRQFPKNNKSSSFVLLPYYQSIPYHSKAMKSLLLKDLEVDSLTMFDFSFFRNGTSLFLGVDVYIVTIEDSIHRQLMFETPLESEILVPQQFSFDSELKYEILQLLVQFEDYVLLKLPPKKNN